MTVVELATGAEMRLTGGGRTAVVCVNGGQAAEVEGTWSASLEWLVGRLAPRFPELTFAEVRYRRDQRFGGAAESVTSAKRARLVAAARLYLMRRPDADCRFDVLLLDSLDGRAIQWIRNAFVA